MKNNKTKQQFNLFGTLGFLLSGLGLGAIGFIFGGYLLGAVGMIAGIILGRFLHSMALRTQ